MYICFDPNSSYATTGETIEDAYDAMIGLNCSSEPIDDFKFLLIPDGTVFEYYTTQIVKKQSC